MTKLCAQKNESKSNTVKKSFRPHDYDDDDDDDDDEDYDDYNETPDEEEFPGETEAGSYRSFDDSPSSAPRDHERFYDDESEHYDRDSWQGHDFDDEDYRPLERPGYEHDMDDWDWDLPRRDHGRHAFTSTAIFILQNDFATIFKKEINMYFRLVLHSLQKFQ